MAILSEAAVTGHVTGNSLEGILSEAVVTQGEALGNTKNNNCLEDSTLSYDDYYQGTVFQTVTPGPYNPRTVSWVTTALPPFGQWVQGQISLSTALQAGL